MTALIPVGLVTYPLGGALALLGFLALARWRRPWRWWLPTLGLIGCGLLAALASAWPKAALADALLAAALVLALPLLVTRLSRHDVLGLGLGLAAAALAMGFRAVQQVYLLGLSQAKGFTFHPNVGASLALLAAFGLLAGFGLSKRWPYRVLVLAGLAAALAALVLSGSRSAYLGFAAGLGVYLALVALRRARRLGLLVAALALAGVAAWWWAQRPGAAPPVNLVVNSGFSRGVLGWRLGPASALLPQAGEVEGQLVQLGKGRPGWEVALSNARLLPVDAETVYTLSLYLRSAEAPVPGTFVRVEAFDSERRFLARAGRDGWTQGDEGRAGGRNALPTGSESWTRYRVTLPPTPAGTAFVRLSVANDGQQLGSYGWLDAVQLERGAEASPYLPGPPPEPWDYLGPLAPRLAQLLEPGRSSGGRLFMARLGLELAAGRPLLGYGYGAWQRLVPEVEPSFPVDTLPHSHNLYVELLLEAGSLTLVALLLFLGALGWALLRRALRGDLAAAAALAALAGFGVSNLFDVLAYQPYLSGLLWLVLAQGLVADAAEPPAG